MKPDTLPTLLRPITRPQPIRPWLIDIAAAIGVIALCVFAFVALDVAAEMFGGM